jgi:hypothetical protein
MGAARGDAAVGTRIRGCALDAPETPCHACHFDGMADKAHAGATELGEQEERADGAAPGRSAPHWCTWSAKDVRHSIFRPTLQYAAPFAGHGLCTVPTGADSPDFSREGYQSVCDTLASK